MRVNDSTVYELPFDLFFYPECSLGNLNVKTEIFARCHGLKHKLGEQKWRQSENALAIINSR